MNKEKNQMQSLDDFRREQVTEVIKRVYDNIKAENPNIRFGVSPFGIWRNKTSEHHGSNTDPRCSQSYSNEYAD